VASESLTAALENRARTAAAAAAGATRRAQLLVASRHLVHERQWMLTRCAWCGRLSFGDVWAEPGEAPAFLPSDLDGRTTHGICADCLDGLERSGRSRHVELP
jgi:hypothetical protein